MPFLGLLTLLQTSNLPLLHLISGVKDLQGSYKLVPLRICSHWYLVGFACWGTRPEEQEEVNVS